MPKKVMAVSLDQELIKLIDEYAALTDRSRSAVVTELVTCGFHAVSDVYQKMRGELDNGINHETVYADSGR